jgi:hypothetical protein
LLAIGLENGAISLWTASEQPNPEAKRPILKWTLFLQIEALYPCFAFFCFLRD